MELKKVGILSLAICALISSGVATAFAEADGYAGSESCKDCHEKEFKAFLKTNHGNKLDPRAPMNVHGCETCHGPMAKHVDAEGKGFVQPVSAESCMQCHDKGKQALWMGSEHERHDVSCVDCHNPHKGNPMNLVAPTEMETCAKCHKDVRAQLMRTSHHPLREGKMQCSDCHNPHGTVADKLISANTLNEKCYECHAEKRGPFLWEHAPVTESCSNCHVPHGSSHPSLLVSRTPFLCQQCHSNSRHPGTLYATDSAKPGSTVYANLNNRVFYRACLNCHSQVHGSNHPSGESLLR